MINETKCGWKISLNSFDEKMTVLIDRISDDIFGKLRKCIGGGGCHLFFRALLSVVGRRNSFLKIMKFRVLYDLFWGDRDNVHLFLIYFLAFEVRLMCGRVA